MLNKCTIFGELCSSYYSLSLTCYCLPYTHYIIPSYYYITWSLTSSLTNTRSLTSSFHILYTIHPSLLHTQSTYSSQTNNNSHTRLNLTAYTIPPELPLYHSSYTFPLSKIQIGRALTQFSPRFRHLFLMPHSSRLDSTGYLRLDTQVTLQTGVPIFYFHKVPGHNFSYDWIQPASTCSNSGTI